MADEDWVDVSGPQDGSKPKRKSAAGRKLVRWNPAVDQLALLCVDYVCVKNGISLPYDEIAREIADQLSGEGLKQHLAKVIKARLDANQKVPPKLPKSARRSTLKEPLQDDFDSTDSQPASALIWEAPEKKKKRPTKATNNFDPAPTNIPGYGSSSPVNQVNQAMPASYSANSQDKKRKAVKQEVSEDEYAPYSPPAKKPMTNSYSRPQASIEYHDNIQHNHAVNEPQAIYEQAAPTSPTLEDFYPLTKFNSIEGATGPQARDKNAAILRGMEAGEDIPNTTEGESYGSPRQAPAHKPRVTPSQRRHRATPASDSELQQKRGNFLKSAPLDVVAQWSPEMYHEAIKARGENGHNGSSVSPRTASNGPVTPRNKYEEANVNTLSNSQKLLIAAQELAQQHAQELAQQHAQEHAHQPGMKYEGDQSPPRYVNMNDIHNQSGVRGQFAAPRFLPGPPPVMKTHLFNGLPVADPQNSGLNATLGTGYVADHNGNYNAFHEDDVFTNAYPQASTQHSTNASQNASQNASPSQSTQRTSFSDSAYGGYFDIPDLRNVDLSAYAQQDFNDDQALGAYNNYDGLDFSNENWNLGLDS